ncbi:MAG: hypothetical protein ACI9H8_002562 [Lysobacterales bacterium]|jgi:hypothetical protein
MNRLLILVTVLFACPALAAELYFIGPSDGQQTGSTVTVQFGLKGMGVTPAGHEAENTGHHHLLIDMDELPDLNYPLPKNDHLMHFGGGQTEVTLELEPGSHTLQLVLGNHLHTPHSPPVMSEKITIHVGAE